MNLDDLAELKQDLEREKDSLASKIEALKVKEAPVEVEVEVTIRKPEGANHIVLTDKEAKLVITRLENDYKLVSEKLAEVEKINPKLSFEKEVKVENG